MPTDNWRHAIATLQQQVETVHAAAAHPTQGPESLQEAIEVLRTAMEALRVAEEELSQQHETLAVAQQATAAVCWSSR